MRINKGECELCRKKSDSENVVVHHVRKLKNLETRYAKDKIPFWVKQMKKIRRKTLIVCTSCHEEIHGI